MTKNEKAIYKSGRKNENGYPRFQLTKKQKNYWLMQLLLQLLEL